MPPLQALITNVNNKINRVHLKCNSFAFTVVVSCALKKAVFLQHMDEPLSNNNWTCNTDKILIYLT